MTGSNINNDNNTYVFGTYRLDMSEYLLKRDDIVIPLTPKALETLWFLVRNKNRVVAKEEFMHALWPDTFVEENNLTQNISQIRRALGSNSFETTFIKTVPKRGYKFIAEVRVCSWLPPLASSSEKSTDDSQQQRAIFETTFATPRQSLPQPKLSHFRTIAFISIALLIILLAIFYLFIKVIIIQQDVP